MPQPTARTYLGTEASRLRNAAASLDFIMSSPDDLNLFIAIDQQAGWVIGELEHAIARIKRAQTAVEASRAIARCEAEESADITGRKAA